MKTLTMTGAVMAVALMASTAVQAGNVQIQEPYANFAVEQNTIHQDSAVTGQPTEGVWVFDIDTSS